MKQRAFGVHKLKTGRFIITDEDESELPKNGSTRIFADEFALIEYIEHHYEARLVGREDFDSDSFELVVELF